SRSRRPVSASLPSEGRGTYEKVRTSPIESRPYDTHRSDPSPAREGVRWGSSPARSRSSPGAKAGRRRRDGAGLINGTDVVVGRFVTRRSTTSVPITGFRSGDSMDAIDAYLAGPKDLRAAVAGLSRDQLVARPIPGKWSALEVVCHLADTDANIAYR